MKIIIQGLILIAMGCLTSCGDGAENSESKEDTVDSSGTFTDTLIDLTEENTKKEELLRSLVGEYKLTYISAFMGANTMADYSIENGSWWANGSSNNGGQREGYEIELDDFDIERLNSAKIVVNEDLTVFYSCMNEKYFISPFKNSEMEYKLKNPTDYFIGTIPEDLSKKTTFLNDDLFLYAEDEIDETLMKPIDIAEVWADAVLIVYTSEGNFEMSLFYGDCCDNSTYIFE